MWKVTVDGKNWGRHKGKGRVSEVKRQSLNSINWNCIPITEAVPWMPPLSLSNMWTRVAKLCFRHTRDESLHICLICPQYWKPHNYPIAPRNQTLSLYELKCYGFRKKSNDDFRSEGRENMLEASNWSNGKSWKREAPNTETRETLSCRC